MIRWRGAAAALAALLAAVGSACVVQPTGDELLLSEEAADDPDAEPVEAADRLEGEEPQVVLERSFTLTLPDPPVDLMFSRVGSPALPGEDPRPGLLSLDAPRGQIDLFGPPPPGQDEWPLVGSFFAGAGPQRMLEVSLEGRTMTLVVTENHQVMLLAARPEEVHQLEFPVRVFHDAHGIDAVAVGDATDDGDDDLIVIHRGTLRVITELRRGIGANPENPPALKGSSLVIDGHLDPLAMTMVPGQDGDPPWLLVSRRDAQGVWIYDLSGVVEDPGGIEPQALPLSRHGHALAAGPCPTVPVVAGLVQGGIQGLDPDRLGGVSPSAAGIDARRFLRSGSAAMLEDTAGRLWLDTACLDAPRRVPLPASERGALAIGRDDEGVWLATTEAGRAAVTVTHAR